MKTLSELGVTPEMFVKGTFIMCIHCGIPFPARMSADISQCHACHRLLNRLVLIPRELAVEAWENYKKVVDAIRGPDEPAPSSWSRKLYGCSYE